MLKIEILDVKKKTEGSLMATFKAKVFFGEGEAAPSITLPKMRLVRFATGPGVDAPVAKTFEKEQGKKEYIKAFYPNKVLNDLIKVEAIKAYEALPKKGKDSKEK